MTAETLRRAAATMRERAEKATPGPWETYRNMHYETFVSEVGRRGFGVISHPATGREDYGRGNAAHIAGWHPAVAVAVADLLENVARGLMPGCTVPPEASDVSQALTIARAYLGEVTS